MGMMTALVRSGPPAVTRGVASSPELLASLGAMQSLAGVYVSQDTAMSVATVNACVRIRAQSVARCTPRLVAKADIRTSVDHPIARLLARPNRVQTWFEFAEMLAAATVLRGNAFVVLLRDRYGEPTEMIPVNPDLVQMLEAPDGSLFYQIARAGLWLMAVLAAEPIAVPAADVIHIRDLSFNALTGLSRIRLARDAVGLAISQEKQAGLWASNGARPAGVLQVDKALSQDAAERLKARWESLQNGVQNAGRTAVLEDGVEWKPMQLTSVDLEFLNSRVFQIRDVCRHFDVPPHMVGEAGNLGRSSVAELNADFVQRVVMADVDRIEQKFERAFELDEQGLTLIFDNRELLRADLKTQVDLARAGVLSGILTQNEARAQIGYPPVDGGDVLLAPVNLAPNGSAIDGRAPDGAGRPKDGEEPAP